MATPNKRRRTNGFQASPQTVRGLDFFFAKQKDENAAKAAKEDGLQKQLDDAPCLAHENPTHDVTFQALADEELARKLQLEWNSETRVRDEAENLKEKVSSQTNGNEEPASDAAARGQQPSPKFDAEQVERHKEDAYPDLTQNLPETLSLQSASSSKDVISSTIPFDENPLQFDPSKYLPDLKRHWAIEGGDASYGLLIRCFVLVNATQSRIKIVDTLVNFLRTVIEGDPESLLPAVSMLIAISNW